MPAEVLEQEPTEVTIGSAVSWVRSFEEWAPSDGTVTYAFRPANGATGGFEITATDNGDGRFAGALAATATAGKLAGAWVWAARIVSSGETYVLDSARLEFLPDLFAATVETRGYWERQRDAIRSALEADDYSVLSTYSFDNRSLSKFSKEELFDALGYCEEMMRYEANKLAAERGEPLPFRSTIRMVMP
jgi:hypothetical protein